MDGKRHRQLKGSRISLSQKTESLAAINQHRQLKGMSGQFFILGAFILMIMFWTGISAYLSAPLFSNSGPQEINYLIKNMVNEYPKAFNSGLNQVPEAGIGALVNFTLFCRNASAERNMDFYAIWIVTENVSNDLNVTVGNFLGYPVNVTLDLSGVVKTVFVGNDSVNSTLFTNPAETFPLDISFNSGEKNLILGKRKANLYFLLQLHAGDDVMVGERTS
jgi:hypothetical protein